MDQLDKAYVFVLFAKEIFTILLFLTAILVLVFVWLKDPKKDIRLSTAKLSLSDSRALASSEIVGKMLNICIETLIDRGFISNSEQESIVRDSISRKAAERILYPASDDDTLIDLTISSFLTHIESMGFMIPLDQATIIRHKVKSSVRDSILEATR